MKRSKLISYILYVTWDVVYFVWKKQEKEKGSPPFSCIVVWWYAFQIVFVCLWITVNLYFEGLNISNGDGANLIDKQNSLLVMTDLICFPNYALLPY